MLHWNDHTIDKQSQRQKGLSRFCCDNLRRLEEIEMPHVVLSGKVDVEDIFDRLDPLFIRNGRTILKTSTAYMDRQKKSILIESLAIEEGKKIEFLATIGQREDGIVVRIYPGSEVEKTDGVKKILAEIATQLLDTFAELEVGKTNISDFLKQKREFEVKN